MANIKLEDLYLSKEVSRDITELLAKKRSIVNYKTRSSDKLYNTFKKQSKNKKKNRRYKRRIKKTQNILFQKVNKKI